MCADGMAAAAWLLLDSSLAHAAPPRVPHGRSLSEASLPLTASSSSARRRQSAGFALSCSARYAAAYLRHLHLDGSNVEVGKLRSGLTLSFWMRFNSFGLDNEFTPPITIQHALDVNFIQAFGGANQGFLLLGTGAPEIVRLLDNPFAWHHFALTFNATDGDVQIYADGRPVASTSRLGVQVPVLTTDVYFMLCTMGEDVDALADAHDGYAALGGI